MAPATRFSSVHIPPITPATPSPTQILHIPPIAPAAPPPVLTKWQNHTPLVVLVYGLFFCFVIKITRKLWATWANSTSTHAAEADPANVMPRHEARLKASLTWAHIGLSLYLNGFMSALLGIALSNYYFTSKFLPEYEEGYAKKENSNAICYFVDSSVLLLSTIYEVAIVVGLLLYATLSQMFSLRWMVLITPATLWIGVATSFWAGKLSTLLVGRFFMGLAPGFVFEINNRLIEEFAPKQARAKLLCWNKLSYVGSIAAYTIAYHTSSRGHLWRLIFHFLYIPLIPFTTVCIVIAISYTGNIAAVTFGQLRRARALIFMQLKYQIFTAVLGLDILIQYMPEYFTFLDVLEDEDYLAPIIASVITMLIIVFASAFKLERFGRSVLFAIVLVVLLTVGILHVLLDRLPLANPAPHQPVLMISVTGIYCAVIGLTKIDPEMLKPPDDVRPAISIFNRTIESIVNIIIVLSVSYFGCMFQLYVLFVFVGFVVWTYDLITKDF